MQENWNTILAGMAEFHALQMRLELESFQLFLVCSPLDQVRNASEGWDVRLIRRVEFPPPRNVSVAFTFIGNGTKSVFCFFYYLVLTQKQSQNLWAAAPRSSVN
ncbi:conserved hypothetical protein [Ricinus communis]|uniref:Uncharacterized protein n=1 Tax=Ricinus communis TaxID=3988 RepID=B9SIT5_RICCO|nr:conserved hypothetical protein [Ricinus communis]